MILRYVVLHKVLYFKVVIMCSSRNIDFKSPIQTVNVVYLATTEIIKKVCVVGELNSKILFLLFSHAFLAVCTHSSIVYDVLLIYCPIESIRIILELGTVFV